MIQGVHAMFYSTDPEATRAFLRDKLRFPHSDVGDGWLIFDAPEGDIGVHPGETPAHDISFYTRDVRAAVAELKERDVECRPIEDRGYGLVTAFELPGVGPVQLYQPKYTKSSG